MAAEQLSVELVAEFVGRDAFAAMQREVAQIKNSLAGMDQAQQRVVRSSGEAEKAIRGQRMATTQLGMQISQISTQLSTGTSAATVFAQQIGDVGFALSGMRGVLGRVGAFLSGPWGVGLTVAAMAVTALWDTFAQSEPASKGFESAMKRSEDAVFNYRMAIAGTRKEVIGLYQDQLALLEANWKKAVNETGRLESNVEGARQTFKDWTSQPGWKLLTAGKTMLFDAKELKKAKEEQANAFAAMIEFQTTFENAKKGFQRQDEAAAKRSNKAFEKAQREAEKLAEKQREVAEEIRIFTIKDSVDFAKSMEKMSQDSSAAIDKSALGKLPDLLEAISGPNEKLTENILKPLEEIKDMADTMGQAFSNGIKGMITGAMSFKQVMSNVIDAVISKLFEMFVVQQITGFIAGAITSAFGFKPGGAAAKSMTSTSGFTAGLSGAIRPLTARAIGGPVQSGQPYMVGERGPEMFVPSRSGSIVPNNNMSSGMVINVDARGASDPAAVRMQVEQGIAQAAPYIIAAAQNRTMKAASRPRLPGTIG
jgi:hypothetical protein